MLDPQAARLVQAMRSAGFNGLAQLGVDGARGLVDQQATYQPGPELHGVEDREVEVDGSRSVVVRLYRPSADPALPVLVCFHGGGWVTGSLDSHDATCRHLARAAGWLVVAVDYRRPPEDPFPAAIEDAWAATRWVADHAEDVGGDPERLAVAGDSAGGNLAAVVARLARDHELAVALQVLIYPVIDRRLDRPSMLEDPQGAESVLTRADMEWFWGLYDPDGVACDDPLAAPSAARDLAGSPPAVVLTAEHDPLRDEGEEYAAWLAASGVPTQLTRYPGVFHGFFGLHGLLDAADQALDHVATALQAVATTTTTRGPGQPGSDTCTHGGLS